MLANVSCSTLRKWLEPPQPHPRSQTHTRTSKIKIGPVLTAPQHRLVATSETFVASVLMDVETTFKDWWKLATFFAISHDACRKPQWWLSVAD